MGGRAPQAISVHHSRPWRPNEARFVGESGGFPRRAIRASASVTALAERGCCRAPPFPGVGQAPSRGPESLLTGKKAGNFPVSADFTKYAPRKHLRIE